MQLNIVDDPNEAPSNNTKRKLGITNSKRKSIEWRKNKIMKTNNIRANERKKADAGIPPSKSDAVTPGAPKSSASTVDPVEPKQIQSTIDTVAPTELTNKPINSKSSIVDDKKKSTAKKSPLARSINPNALTMETVDLSMEKADNMKATEYEEPSSDHKSFADLGISTSLVKVLTDKVSAGGMGFMIPTLVQSLCIPHLLLGRDLMMKSHTGSGKTLSFAIPILHNLHQSRVSRSDGVYAIIMSPTRELCFQITQVLEEISKPFHWIIVGSIVGGEKRKSEKARLRKGINILVATPGRLIDHLDKTKTLKESLQRGKLRWLVLDEADRLTDSGFSKQIDSVLTILERNREATEDGSPPMQTVLVSATFNESVMMLGQRILFDPITVQAEQSTDEPFEKALAEQEGESMNLPKQLVQHFVMVGRKERLTALCSFILRQVKRSSNTCRIMVFVSCRAVVEFLSSLLTQVEWPPSTGHSDSKNLALGTRFWKLHGSMDQLDRKRTIGDYSKAKGGVLICTDVAARGLDLPFVDWIIQYDPPSELSEYVHRVGRTARSGRKGSALLFLTPEEQEYVALLKDKQVSLSEISLQSIFAALTRQDGQAAKGTSIKQRSVADPDAAAALLQIKLEDLVDSTEGKVNLQVMAQEAHLAFIRAYAVHSKETKSIFHPKKLHLGHVARSFGLREQPTGINVNSKTRRDEKQKGKDFHKKKSDFEKQVKKAKSDQFSEFAAS